MNVVTAHFRACRPTPWSGRYRRVMGDASVFHLRYAGGRLWPMILWETEEGVGTCRAVECAAAVELVDAVARAKCCGGGDGGGSFVVNEYGQVIVPSSDGSGKRFLAGRLNGKLLFENPFLSQELIDLGDDGHLENGDPWKLPYVGMRYNLHRSGNIYFYQEDENGARSLYPPRQDYNLIRAIRNVRPNGAVRILVNPAGLVLTKVRFNASQQSEDFWQPVYVGCINPSLWFEKE